MSSEFLFLFRCINISGSTRYILAAVVASLGGVLFGYDLGMTKYNSVCVTNIGYFNSTKSTLWV